MVLFPFFIFYEVLCLIPQTRGRPLSLKSHSFILTAVWALITLILCAQSLERDRLGFRFKPRFCHLPSL